MPDRNVRQVRFWGLQDLSVGHGLEIGPLYRPTVRPEEARVSYVDVFSTQQLREHYADDARVTLDTIPEIDFTLQDEHGVARTLPEATGSRAPYDWVIASHVIEHVPNLIAWLEQVAEIIVDGGALLLAVPDRRYTFDLHRPLTTVGQMLQAYDAGDTEPSIRAVYDHIRSHVTVNTQQLWAGATPPGYDGRTYGLPRVRERMVKARAGEYVDSHVWVFTPDTFLAQIAELRRLGLICWYVDSLGDTPRNELEFMVRMRRLPRGTDPALAQPVEVTERTPTPDWLLAETAARTRIGQLERQVARLREQVVDQKARVREQRGAVREQKAAGREQRRELREQRDLVRRLSRRVARMEASRRWRVGGAVLAPARVVARLGRRVHSRVARPAAAVHRDAGPPDHQA